MLRYSNVKMKNKGFTLLEVIIAIFLVLVGITGTFALITKTMGVMAVSSSRLIAAYLSQEGIEVIRNIRDTNWIEGALTWDDGLLCGAPPCDWEADYQAQTLNDEYDGDYLNIDGNGFYSYSTGIPTKFKRKITIAPDGSDILKVTVMVEWKEKGETYIHTVQENLYNWK